MVLPFHLTHKHSLTKFPQNHLTSAIKKMVKFTPTPNKISIIKIRKKDTVE
jgi:hypothetical protein